MRSLFPRRSELAFTRKPFSLISRAYFFHSETTSALKPTQARARFIRPTRERERKTYVPVYCSTSDFTHPLSPSSNVSKNAAPSNFCCSFPFAREREDPVVTNATVATVAIVFNPPILFTCVLCLIDKYVCVCVFKWGKPRERIERKDHLASFGSNTKSLEKRELFKGERKEGKTCSRVLVI